MGPIRVDAGIWAVDLGLLGREAYGATYIVRGKAGVALVEVGTSPCIPRLLAGLEALAVAPEEVRSILVTHIHMDHAGAAGDLLLHLPRAQLVAHSRSHRHFVDPTRLRAGVAAAVGSLLPLYGDLRPVPPERLVAGETLSLDLGGLHLEAIPTPGHSRDHLAYFLPEKGLLFAGDAAGVSLFEHRFLRPATVPPHFDLEETLRSLERMAALQPRRLAFTHFGIRDDPASVFEHLRETLLRWDALRRSGDLATLREMIRAELVPPLAPPPTDLWERLGEMNLRGFLMAYEGDDAAL